MSEFELPMGEEIIQEGGPAVVEETLDTFIPNGNNEAIIMDEEQSGMDALPEPENENDSTIEFNKQWNTKINALRAEESSEVKKVNTTAAEELSAWNKQRDVRMTTKKEVNRSEEKATTDALAEDANTEGKNAWERVMKLVSTLPDAGSAAASKADTGRMHRLFIQLKNEQAK